MSTARVSTTLALIAGLALAPLPAFAQDARQGGGDRQQGQSRGERRRPRDGGQRQGRNAQRPDQNGQAQENRGADRREAVPRAEVPRNDNRGRDNGRQAEPYRDNRGGNDGRRAEPYRGNRGRGDYDGWRDNRGRSTPRYLPAPRAYRNYGRPSRSYVVPYGYRPQGYRPGWSLNLYFGRPYAYGNRYPGGYYNGGYGYYALRPGYVYGSLRIVDAPRYAQVFVDGYYAGVVDDYDGVFQRLNLEPGEHQVEIEVYQGAPPLTFDVYVEPGRTMTIHAQP